MQALSLLLVSFYCLWQGCLPVPAAVAVSFVGVVFSSVGRLWAPELIQLKRSELLGPRGFPSVAWAWDKGATASIPLTWLGRGASY